MVIETPSEAVDKLEDLEASQEDNEDKEKEINIFENNFMKSFEECLEEAFAPFNKELGNLNKELCLLNIKEQSKRRG